MVSKTFIAYVGKYLVLKIGINKLRYIHIHFMAGRGTIDAIALLRVISEKAIDRCKDIFVAFVDYEKAFDRVHWPKLMEVLAKIGVDYRDRKMIWNLYMNQTESVMIDGELSDPAVIEE